MPDVKLSTSNPASLARRRVLVVDDNCDSAMSMAMLLKFSGNDTRTAHDGLSAVAAAEDFRPNVVILDLGLPKLNGFEVAQKIRSEPWGESMALIAVSGWDRDEDRRRSADAGFNRHFVKPVDHQELNKALLELCPTAV